MRTDTSSEAATPDTSQARTTRIFQTGEEEQWVREREVEIHTDTIKEQDEQLVTMVIVSDIECACHHRGGELW